MSSADRLRIAFLWDWNPSFEQTITWQDGLAGAIKELQDRQHEVFVIIPTEQNMNIKHPLFDIVGSSDVVALIKLLEPDVILHWADMTRPHAKPLFKLGIPQAICFAGGEPLGETYPYFNHVFVESKVYLDVFIEADIPTSIAFGTNTDLFTPMPEQPKIIDTLFPATFAEWKRHDIYAKATKGLNSLAFGYIYTTHEQECWQVCLDNGVAIMPHVSAESLRNLYAMSKSIVITSRSNGGSQRTVLEALAMNIPLIVCDSDKFDYAKGRSFEADPNPQSVRGYIDVILDGEFEMNTRDYVLENWSHKTYADSLEYGLRSML